MTDRAAAVAYARTLDGLSADPADPYARAEYELAIARGETEARAEAMARMSGCALLAAGVLRAVGVRCPLLAPPYRTGTAVSRLVAMATSAGAWRVPAEGWPELPRPGDVVLVAPPEHVFTVLTEPEYIDPEVRLEALDGGLRDARGYQRARIRDHAWTPEDRARLPGAAWSRPRRVVGWIDLDALLVVYR